jgi:hypothetical protein
VQPFCIFCKSFRDDLERFERLLDSFHAHNVDRLPLLVSVPERDRPLFSHHFGARHFELTSDEQLVGRAVRHGWRGQQVVKLHWFRAQFAQHALLVDSDFYFIRDFRRQDFMLQSGAPRIVLSRIRHTYEPDNQALLDYLSCDTQRASVSTSECAEFRRGAPRPKLPPRLWLTLTNLGSTPYDERLERIRRAFPRGGPGLQVMPGPIMRARLLQRLFDELLDPARISAEALIHYAPWEYQWYAEWQLAQGLDGAEPCEPLFLHFARADALQHARAAGLSERALARRYVGLAMAARHFDEVAL